MSEPIQSIAQNNYILATQQEVSHDNTLSGNGTVESPLGVVPGYNETVLWSGNSEGNITLSERCTNFEKLELTTTNNEIITIKVAEQNFSLIFCPSSNTNYVFFSFVNFTLSGTNITTNVGQVLNAGAFTAEKPNITWDKSTSFKRWCVKVVGINRIANN